MLFRFFCTLGALSATAQKYIQTYIICTYIPHNILVCAPYMGICANVPIYVWYIVYFRVAQSVSSSRKLQRYHFLSVFPATFPIRLCFVGQKEKKIWIFWNFVNFGYRWCMGGLLNEIRRLSPGFDCDIFN